MDYDELQEAICEKEEVLEALRKGGDAVAIAKLEKEIAKMEARAECLSEAAYERESQGIW